MSAAAALGLRVERLLREARAVLLGLLQDPLPLLRRQPPPDIEQREGNPDRAETTREAEARHAPRLLLAETGCERCDRLRRR